jgi:hypothetical protein
LNQSFGNCVYSITLTNEPESMQTDTMERLSMVAATAPVGFHFRPRKEIDEGRPQPREDDDGTLARHDRAFCFVVFARNQTNRLLVTFPLFTMPQSPVDLRRPTSVRP